ncbi:MAG: flagellar brake protein [Lachnospiraceae bacterium]|nr:flagellar brake protein [Lachnospiraceae bacterium]
MVISDIIKVGDKIDIKLLHQNQDKVYKSSIYNTMSLKDFEITMPLDGTKMVLFSVGLACQFYIYTKTGAYTCEATVTNRYRRGNSYLLLVHLDTTLKKYQRREFFRIEKMMDFFYYKVTEEVAQKETTRDIYKELLNPKYIDERRVATTKDLSGGGMRFIVDEEFELDTVIVAVLQLKNAKVDQNFYLVTRVIDIMKVEDMPGRYIIRSKFDYKDDAERELLVSYVFEEDRAMRKKSNGR